MTKVGALNDESSTLHKMAPPSSAGHEDPIAFRNAMRRVATSVAIITAHDQGVDYGMTATAFAPVSMAPPLVLIIVNEATTIHGPLLKSRRFCLNVLDVAQESVGRRFSAKPSDESRFQDGQWIRDGKSPARLQGTQAWIDCEVHEVVPAATHTIFIGKVMSAHASDAGSPLAYFDGRYAGITV
jgi:flavin reductase